MTEPKYDYEKIEIHARMLQKLNFMKMLLEEIENSTQNECHLDAVRKAKDAIHRCHFIFNNLPATSAFILTQNFPETLQQMLNNGEITEAWFEYYNKILSHI